MSKKTKILYIILIIIIFVVSVLTFYDFFIKHNYLISYQVSCNPKTESCFMVECDQETGEGCDLNKPQNYYKLVERKAYKIINCSKEDLECLLCQINENNCKITLCDPDIEGNTCSTH